MFQGQMLVDFGLILGGILKTLGSTLALFWGYTGSKKRKQQHISAHSSKHAANSSKRHEKPANSSKKHQIIENRGKRHEILKS